MALGSASCSSQQSSNPAAQPPSGTSDSSAAVEWGGEGTLTTPGQSSNAFTYNPVLAPTGGQVAINLTQSNGSTKATFDVSGLLPHRGYAVHLHAKPCGNTGEAAGPHFQHHVDPAATPEDPSTNPDYANPTNEIWLDLHTDANGSATSTTEVPFVFIDRVPESVVVHEQPVTQTAPGQAGNAGARVACFTLPNK